MLCLSAEMTKKTKPGIWEFNKDYQSSMRDEAGETSFISFFI